MNMIMMTTIKTSELIGLALDWAVAKCEDQTRKNYGLLKRIQIFTGAHTGLFRLPKSTLHNGSWYKPSTDWAQGGPIIEREKIELSPPFISVDGLEFPTWGAGIHQAASQVGPTPLITAMRCYVASKLGDEVDVPSELL